MERKPRRPGHADDLNGPMFRPLSHNRKGHESRRHMAPDAIYAHCSKHTKALGLDGMAATFADAGPASILTTCFFHVMPKAAG